jgi:hypothetical protein
MNGPRNRSGNRGQAAVEFAVFSVLLILAMFLMAQLSVIAMQKWQFNHFSAYIARAWSTHTDWSPTSAMGQVMARGILRWSYNDGRFVLPLSVSEVTDEVEKGDGSEVSVNGLRFRGIRMTMEMYRRYLGLGAGFGFPTGTGIVDYETYIPMEKEPEEEPNNNRRDNDCTGTPCDGGNGK